MTEPKLNENGQPQPQSPAQADIQGQPATAPVVKPIDEPVAEPKTGDTEKWRDTAIVRKRRRPPLAVVIVVSVVVLALIGLIGWRFLAPKAAPLTALPAAQSLAPVETAKGPLAVYAKGAMAKLVTYETPQTIENISFLDREQKPVQLTDFKGQVVVLNVWATWCAPCRFEMPTLAHLQTLYAGKAVKVLPLSVDRAEDFAAVKSFMDVQQPLEVYADQNFQAPSKYKISGMPGTLILDKQGRMVARLDGETKWDTPEVQALLDKLLAE